MMPPSQFPIGPPSGGMPGMPGMLPKEEAPVMIDNLESVIDYGNVECLNADPKTPVTNALKQDNEHIVLKYLIINSGVDLIQILSSSLISPLCQLLDFTIFASRLIMMVNRINVICRNWTEVGKAFCEPCFNGLQ